MSKRYLVTEIATEAHWFEQEVEADNEAEAIQVALNEGNWLDTKKVVALDDSDFEVKEVV